MNSNITEEKFLKFKSEILDPVSDSFCLAKWHRTTVRADQGESYSCHHCVGERVDKKALVNDPKLLVNPEPVQLHRRQMLAGERPKECEYCWQIEDSGGISDRITKSFAIHRDNIDNHPNLVKDTISNTNGIPKILEICLDNTCNFKCSYCNAGYSSKWFEEMKQYGQYPTSTKRRSLKDSMSIPQREHNPYTEAFWNIWDNHKSELQTLKVTGGEPLLSKNFYRLLDTAASEECSHLTMTVNSNFCPPDHLFDKFITKVNEVVPHIKQFDAFTSLESFEEKAEYGRFGMDFEKFKNNVTRFLEETDCNLYIMMAINVLSVTDLNRFFDYYTSIARIYPDRIMLSSNIVRYPAYLDVRILPQEMLTKIHDQLVYELERKHYVWYTDATRLNVGKILGYLKSRTDYVQRKERERDLQTLREDFVLFVDEHDRRRNTSFSTIYPELMEFYDTVKDHMDNK